MTTTSLRPMTPADVEAALLVKRIAFAEVDAAPMTPSMAFWVARTSHFVEGDLGGCWVAEEDARMLGFATSLRRDDLWALATFAVLPEAQGRGLGRALLDAALSYADPRCTRNC